MRRQRTFWFCVALTLANAMLANAQTPLGTAFTYQGQLKQGGLPVTDTADFQFTLWDAIAGGNQIGAMIPVNGKSVVNGLFTVTLDFGAGAFAGDARWLEIAVRSPSGSGSYTTLSPRQSVTAAPYAVFSSSPWATGTSGTISYSDGNVGVGTETPTRPLHAVGSGDTVYAESATGTAVFGRSSTGVGVVGAHAATGNYAELGRATDAIHAVAFSGEAIYAQSPNGHCIWASSDYGAGVWARCTHPSGRAVYAQSLATSGVGYAGYFSTASPEGYGIFAYVPSPGWAGYFDGRGYFNDKVGIGTTSLTDLLCVAGTARFDVGGGSVSISTPGGWPGIIAYSQNGHRRDIVFDDYGMSLLTSASSSPPSSSTGIAILESGDVGIGTWNPAARLDVVGSGSYVIRATHQAESSDIPAIRGEHNVTDYYGIGVEGVGGYIGVRGVVSPTASYSYTGVSGFCAGGSGTNFGVIGAASGAGTNFGIFASAGGGAVNYAGYFNGDVVVTGNFQSGNKWFKIDHPLDPANKYLNHACVESSDMKNMYDGVVVTDERGYATVALPEWFEALNRDFCYQLTVIDEGDDDAFVKAKVVRKLAGNRFTICTSAPGVEVSWQVTGIRQDPFAKENRIPVEEDKRATDRGKYLHPKARGLSEELGIDYQREHAARERQEAPAEER
jgi:hypothetical protein